MNIAKQILFSPDYNTILKFVKLNKDDIGDLKGVLTLLVFFFSLLTEWKYYGRLSIMEK